VIGMPGTPIGIVRNPHLSDFGGLPGTIVCVGSQFR